MTWQLLAAFGVGLALSLPALWIWLWSPSRWARIERHEAKYWGAVYQPFSALRTIPSLVGSIWILAWWAAILDRAAPHVLDRLAVPVGFLVLLWPMAVPATVWLAGHAAIFIPPGARARQLVDAETALKKSDQRHRDALGERGFASGELRLQGGRSYAIVVLAGGLLLTGAGLLVALFSDVHGWWAAAFFGLCSIVIGAQLVPGLVYLELTAQGFACHQLLKTWRYQWKDVAEFTPIWAGSPMVGFRFQPTYRGSHLVRRFVRPLTGYDASLAGTYGLRAEDLANLMNRWRDRYSNGEARPLG